MNFKIPNSFVARKINILLIGAGGNGSIMATHLAKMDNSLRAISDNEISLNVTISDPDTVSEFNIGRQNFYPADIGLNKANVLVSRFNLFFGIDWYAEECKTDPTDLNISSYDFVISCVDSPKFRYDLGEQFKDKIDINTLWLDMGVNENTGQVILGHLSQATPNALPNIHTMYGTELNHDAHAQSSCSTEQALQAQDFGVNDKAAIESSQLLWQLIRHGELQYLGNFFDLKTGESFPLKPM
jgi:PRTRC genetic system ThiF family protein